MPEWIYFLHPPRDDVAATMTEVTPMGGGIHQVAARSWADA